MHRLSRCSNCAFNLIIHRMQAAIVFLLHLVQKCLKRSNLGIDGRTLFRCNGMIEGSTGLLLLLRPSLLGNVIFPLSFIHHTAHFCAVDEAFEAKVAEHAALFFFVRLWALTIFAFGILSTIIGTTNDTRRLVWLKSALTIVTSHATRYSPAAQAFTVATVLYRCGACLSIMYSCVVGEASVKCLCVVPVHLTLAVAFVFHGMKHHGI